MGLLDRLKGGFGKRPVLVVPAEFNRNHPDVQALGTPAETGRVLLDYMASRLGLGSLAESDMLDFGCGCRFAESILNLGVPIRSYFGVDIYEPMIRFLQGAVTDPRLTFAHADLRNAHYNPGGQEPTAETKLPCEGRSFDVIGMFSVITHQNPHEAEMSVRILRRYVRDSGHLFFSAAIDPEVETFREHDPTNPGALCCYGPSFLKDLLRASGWEQVSHEPRNAQSLPILDSFVCRPAV